MKKQRNKRVGCGMGGWSLSRDIFHLLRFFSPAKMASFAGIEVFLGFKHPLELKDLSAGESRSHLLSTRLPIWTKLEKNIDIFV